MRSFSFVLRLLLILAISICFGCKSEENLKSFAPKIQKLGTIDIGIVETSPIVFKERLYRFEYIRQKSEHNPGPISYFHFIDHETGEASPQFAQSYHLGSAFVHQDSVYVTVSNDWGGEKVYMHVSADLINWHRRIALDLPGVRIFNTSVCKAEDQFIMMYEIHGPEEETGIGFTSRFAISQDLINWTITPPEYNYAKDRYTAGHALRYMDGYYYNFFLENTKFPNAYQTNVARSTDLINWRLSPVNPVLKASADDKIIANPNISSLHESRIAKAENINNSDIDFCEYNGVLIINYSWGNQLGTEFLAEAIFKGTLKEFLEGWFPK